MSLYPKQLKNTEDLQREQEQLKKQLRKLRENRGEALSIGGILGNVANSVGQAMAGGEKKKDKEAPVEGNGKMSMLLELLPLAMPFIEMGYSALQQRMSGPSKKKEKKAAKEAPPQQPTEEKKGDGKSIVRAVIFELISGYLKWKAIELSYKGAKYLIKKRHENRAMRELEEEMG